MRAPFSIRSLFVLMVGGLGAGCDANPAGTPGAGGSGIDGAGGAATTGHGGAGGGAAGASGGPAGGLRVFSGTARVLFNGSSCTNEVGASGDRWCAFITFTDATMYTRSLYVFNASHAAAGVPVTCGTGSSATDVDCLSLTANFESDSGGPVVHGTFFQGDTLVYYEYQQGRLVPFVWRPGMTAGRLLVPFDAGQDVEYCTPAPRGSAVLCVLVPATNSDPNVGLAQLMLGRADGPSEPLLSLAETVVLWTSADAGFEQTFSFGFPPGFGNRVAWTTRDGATGPETLKMQKVDDPASKVTIASAVHQWTVSDDGASWFWLSTKGSDGNTLQTAPYPSGANPTDVRVQVSDYGVVGSTASAVVALVRDGGLVAITNPATTPTELLLDTQVKSLLSIGAAGHVAYAKSRYDTNVGDLYVKSTDGATTCVLAPTQPVPFGTVSFSPNGGAILWADSYGDGFEANYGRLRDCNTMSVATDISLIKPIGDGRVLFVDQFDAATSSGSLRVRPVGSDNTLRGDAPISIADHVDSYAITGPTPAMLMYTVNGGDENDGVYVRWFAD